MNARSSSGCRWGSEEKVPRHLNGIPGRRSSFAEGVMLKPGGVSEKQGEGEVAATGPEVSLSGRYKQLTSSLELLEGLFVDLQSGCSKAETTPNGKVWRSLGEPQNWKYQCW